MKLLLLADSSSLHTRKWATYFQQQGVNIEILTLSEEKIGDIPIHRFVSNSYAKRKSNVDYNRRAVLMEVLPQIKRLIKKIKPDIVHSHYLSSYGLFGSLAGFHPFIVSIWGSDITDFPYQGIINRYMVKYVLNRADVICVSSKHLAEETSKFTDKETELVFFGTDFDVFKPIDLGQQEAQKSDEKLEGPAANRDKPFIFGVVKKLQPHYGIHNLIEAAAIFDAKIREEKGEADWELWIGGDGDEYDSLRLLAKSLRISDKVKFLGRIEHNKLPELFSKMDLFIVPSLRESFGVVCVEASACCLPLIVSNTGGLPETVADGKTGFCVQPGNPKQIAEKIVQLYKDKELRIKMGKAAQDYVKQRYSFEDNAQKMLDIYRRTLSL